MEQMNNYLLVLSESLDKKISILEKLSLLTNQQKEIAEAVDFDDDAFNENVDAKAELIAELEKLDTGFNLLYDNIKKQLENGRAAYKDQIEVLQKKISTILDLNATLQATEARNKAIIEKRFDVLKKEARQARKNQTHAANCYRNTNYSAEACFLDKKK